MNIQEQRKAFEVVVPGELEHVNKIISRAFVGDLDQLEKALFEVWLAGLAQSEEANAALRAENTELQKQLGERWKEVSAFQNTAEQFESRLYELAGLAMDVVNCAYGVDLPGSGVTRVIKLKEFLNPTSGVSGAGGSDEHCWSCRKPFTKSQWLEADGNCPHCNVEVEHEHE